MTTHDPSYDFFATGAPAPAPQEPASRFGTAGAHVASPALPTSPLVGTSAAPEPPTAPPGHHPGAVNQFGTPIDAPTVPTGPYAAPGIGAAPTNGPGMVTAWDPAPGAVGAARAGHRVAARPAQRPGTVLAAGIIAIVVGSLGLILGFVGLLGYAAMSSDLSALESSPELAGSGLDLSGLTTLVLVGVVILLASGVLYLVAGIATAAGRRWGAWTLLVGSVLSIVVTAVQMVTGSGGNGILGIVVSGVVVGLLVTPAAQTWLRSLA